VNARNTLGVAVADDDAALYERRRFSAVALQHPQLSTHADVSSASKGRMPRGGVRVKTGAGEWDLRRVELLDRNRYPSSVAVPRTKRRGDSQVAHDSYVALRKTPASSPILVVAAPYRRLLTSFMRDLTTALPKPDPDYVTFNMAAVFDRLYGEPQGYKATRVTVQTSGEPRLALVSLTGVSPLQSGLWQDIREVVTPYGARVQRSFPDGTARLHIDRLGNMFWHQLFESSVSRVCLALGFLLDQQLTGRTNMSPLERSSDDLEDLDANG
jgi:hypothetical protein